MKFCIETITPERAQELLNTSTGNRYIRENAVDRLVKSIREGRFILTHQGIAIDPEGHLIDGHHRLAACIKAGVPIQTLVIYDANRSEYIDTGTSRSVMDSLVMAGIVQKGSIESDRLTQPLISYIIDISLSQKARKLAPRAMYHTVYLMFQKEIDAVMDIASARKTGGFQKSVILYSMMCAYRGGVSYETLETWYKTLITGDFYCQNDEYMTQVARGTGITLRNYITNYVKGRNVQKNDLMFETIKKCMSAIYHFDHKEIITKLYGKQCYDFVTFTEEELEDFQNKINEPRQIEFIPLRRED